MNQTQIAIEIFNALFNEEQRNELSNCQLTDVVENCHSTEDVENRQPSFPENFPGEINNPVLSDGYGEHVIQAEEVKGTPIILGEYTPMNSPGVITFYKENIKKYSGSLMRKVVNSGVSLGLDTVLFTIYFVVEDIMKHESFHYYCDYKRRLTLAQYCSLPLYATECN